MLTLGLGLGIGQQQVVVSGGGGGGVGWNDTGGTPPSSADWTLSNGNLTANRTANTSFWAPLWAGSAKITGTIVYTVDAVASGAAGVIVGLDFGGETNYPGNNIGAGAGYRQDGVILTSDGIPQSSLATLSAGDKVQVVRSGTGGRFVTFSKWVSGAWVQQGTPVDFNIERPAMIGTAAYPMVSTGNNTGTQVTIDASGW